MLRSENPSPKSRLRLVSQYHMSDILHLRFWKLTNRKYDILHLQYIALEICKTIKINKIEARPAASISYLHSKGHDIETAKTHTSDLRLSLWRVICKVQFRTWMQCKVSTHFLHNWFQLFYVFLNFIVLYLLKWI